MKAASNQRVGKTRISQRKTRRTIRIYKIHNYTNKREKSLTPSEAVVEDHWGRRSENVGGHLRRKSPFSLFSDNVRPHVALSPEDQFTFSNPFTITKVSNGLKIVEKSDLYLLKYPYDAQKPKK